MRNSKIILTALLTIFAAGSIAPVTASAELWTVAGGATFGKEAIQETPMTITGGLLKADSIEYTCPKVQIVGGLINAGSSGMAASITFTECRELVESTKCMLESTTIQTNPVTAEIVNSSEIEITPEGTAEFTRLYLESKPGKICAKRGETVLTGTIRLLVGEPPDEEVSHFLEFSSASNLKANGNVATITGRFDTSLASLKPWSITL